MREEELEIAILAAHDDEDFEKLATLYHLASQLKSQSGDSAEAAYLLTQAFVFALDCGMPLADELRAELVSLGREVF